MSGSGRRADLHAHTCASDGLWPADELVARAVAAGLWGLAVTDHDTLAALPEALAAGRRHGLEVWAGVELGCRAEVEGGRGVDVHVLGLFLDPGRARLDRLEAYLAERRRDRLGRGEEMVRRLRQAGVAVPWEEVLAEAGGGAVGRPHVARVLVRRGAARDLEDAFHRYLSPGRPGYVPQSPLSVAEGARWIREAGGAVVWAHPGLAEIDPERATWWGEIDGVEADHPKHDAQTRLTLREMARARGRVVTGGSDAHGSPGREGVGTCTTPEEGVDELRRRIRARFEGGGGAA